MKKTFALIRSSGKAILRKVVLPRIDDKIETIIISPGGVATTMLMAHISRFKKTNDLHDHDGLKHLPRPPRELLEGKFLPILMITGDPAVVYSSLARRGWVTQQAAKLASVVGVIGTKSLARKAFIRAVIRQRTRWEEAQLSNFMQVNYQEIWDRVDEISAFFDIDKSRFSEGFPPRRQRKS